MTPQQWNQIERQVKLPGAETVKRVAMGLCVESDIALRAAGYDVQSHDVGCRIGQRLEPIFMQAPPSSWGALEHALEQTARAMVGAITLPTR